MATYDIDVIDMVEFLQVIMIDNDIDQQKFVDLIIFDYDVEYHYDHK
jgi:hypothetical protein